MAQQRRPFLNIGDGDTVEVRFQTAVRSRENKDKGYMMHFYDVESGGKEYAFSASPGLQKLLEEDGVGPGSVSTITRRGEGLDTSWRVHTVGGGQAQAADPIPEETRGRPRGPAPARAPTLADLRALFHDMVAFVRDANVDDDTVLTGDGLYAAAATLTAVAMDYGIRPAAKETPKEFVTGIFKRAGVPASGWNDLAESMFGHGVDDIVRDDASMVWTLTENGTNVDPVNEAWTKLVDIDEDDDFPPEEDLPF